MDVSNVGNREDRKPRQENKSVASFFQLLGKLMEGEECGVYTSHPTEYCKKFFEVTGEKIRLDKSGVIYKAILIK